MCKRFFAVAVMLLCAASFLVAGGQTAEEVISHNTEWTLCITDLDVSALPSSRQIMGSIIMRTLTESLRSIEYRIRSTEEVEYYRNLAWSRSQGEAARALSAKISERDLLVFRGDPQWMYQRTLRTYDADIEKLEAGLRSAETAVPVIAERPKLVISNVQSSLWPRSPLEGDEYRFCVRQNADAFLAGDVTEFHGRIYLRLRLYTLYTNSYSWEDGVLFSPEDMDNAVSELGSRVNMVISGLAPAALIVHTTPDDAMIIIDDFWAGTGEVPLRDHAPGIVRVEAHADNHVSAQFDVEINVGEIAEMFINLTPLGVSTLIVDVPGSPDSLVYLGGLYMGNTPLSLELGRDRLSFISVETPSGETGSAVYEGNNARGNVEFISASNTIAFNTELSVSPEEKRVAAARNSFYSAYGRFWIALPVSVLAIGLSNNYINAYVNSPYPTNEMYDRANAANYVSIGGYVLIGLAIIDTVYHIVRYLGASGADANPVVRVTSGNTEYSNTEQSQ